MSDVEPDPIVRDLVRDGANARHQGDWRVMASIGDRLERHGAYAEAWPLLADAPLMRRPGSLPEWRGAPLAGRRLLVCRRLRHAGAEVRMSGFISAALEAGAIVTFAGDPRLMPLFARSFGAIAGNDQPPEFEASYERLAEAFGGSSLAISRTSRPLIPDGERRNAYIAAAGATGKERIGISWYSTSTRKDLPAIADWARLLAKADGQWCSLQYHELDAGLSELRERSGKAIAEAPGGLDQMIDLDGFAAQVAAMDRVVTISNTTAHMAGALRVPCAVILDDHEHLTWPLSGDRTPFYPDLRLVRRRGRLWQDVLDEAWKTVLTLPVLGRVSAR